MSNPCVILFDVMGTLVYNPFEREIPEFFNMTPDELLRQKDPTAWPEFELGVIDEQEYFDRYFRDRRSFDHDRFRKVVAAAYRWIDGACTTLERLADRGHEIHAFSNYPTWYRTIEERLNLSQYLRWTFVSCRTGVRKPSTEAYCGAARSLGLPPSSCLFIDDSHENCHAAEAVGMPAIRFLNMRKLSTELERRGVLS